MVATYAKESGCAVLLVEQHIQIALAVADRGYVLSHGELVVHESADVLRADHQLILSSYLGEVEAAALDRRVTPGVTTRRRTPAGRPR